ncbi:phosphoethanolamine transferase [Prevotella sp. DNF00663]|uniref:phosphoethanolamine transferase n=1 Tax=Prevotella sp. DNF00663 TaxID=1384078 RepID=UPI001E475440|nr:phosphoethanolamine transferase [Prevotella sp. DNF00663]
MLSVIFSYIARKRKVLKILFYLIIIFIFAVNMFLWLVFGTTISPLIFQLVAETNGRESAEFINAFAFSKGAFITYISVILLTAFIVFIEKKWKKIKEKEWLQKRYTTAILGCLSAFLLLTGLYNTKLYYTLYKCQTYTDLEKWLTKNLPFPMDSFTSIVYSIHAFNATNNKIKIAANLAKDTYRQPVTDEVNDSINIIYILGESFIKSHASLYGYKLKTTPFMDAEQKKGNLVAFSDVVAPFNLTTLVEKNTFCCNSLSDGEEWYQTPYFPILFKKAGYQVTMWDIQRDFSKYALFTFSVNSFIYNKEIKKYAYSYTSDKSFLYDGDLVDDFFKSKASRLEKKNLLIFHLLGQHISASDRYPHTKYFSKFSYKDINRDESYMTKDKKQEIAEYDNATLYNDYVIKKIAERYADKTTVMIYFSDHGEEIYDYRDSKGRKNAGSSGVTHNLVKYQYEVPFVIWFSTPFMEKYPNLVKSIRESKDKPFMTDNVCQILFHIVGMKTKWYKADRDLISPHYVPKKRMIAGVDYDKYVKNR